MFVEGRNIEGITSPLICEEVDVPLNVRVVKPAGEFVRKVEEKAEETGDLDVLSRADIEIIALALQEKGVLVTNDFAVQNVAEALGIKVEKLGKGIRKRIRWEWYCPACGRRYKRKGICEVCGTELKRRPRSRE